MNKVKVLFVCTGNTCRSPMAEGLLKQKSEICDVLSAGIHAADGSPASTHAVQVMKRRGIDISRHMAATITPQVLKSADIVLTMTQAQRQAICTAFPEYTEKIQTLGRFAGVNSDIPDPFMGEEQCYEACAKELEKLIELALPKFAQMVQPT